MRLSAIFGHGGYLMYSYRYSFQREETAAYNALPNSKTVQRHCSTHMTVSSAVCYYQCRCWGVRARCIGSRAPSSLLLSAGLLLR